MSLRLVSFARTRLLAIVVVAIMSASCLQPTTFGERLTLDEEMLAVGGSSSSQYCHGSKDCPAPCRCNACAVVMVAGRVSCQCSNLTGCGNGTPGAPNPLKWYCIGENTHTCDNTFPECGGSFTCKPPEPGMMGGMPFCPGNGQCIKDPVQAAGCANKDCK